jgi:hypothetical protein
VWCVFTYLREASYVARLVAWAREKAFGSETSQQYRLSRFFYATNKKVLRESEPRKAPLKKHYKNKLIVGFQAL